MSKDFLGRSIFMSGLVVATALLTECGLGHNGTKVSNDARYDQVSISFLAEQNRLYRDALLASQQDLAACEKTIQDVAEWNGPSPVLKKLERPLAQWRARLRASLRREFTADDLKASYASENLSFRSLLADSYPQTLESRWALTTYQQGVQTRAGGSVAAWELDRCQVALGNWTSRLDQAVLPEEILAWRQKN